MFQTNAFLQNMVVTPRTVTAVVRTAQVALKVIAALGLTAFFFPKQTPVKNGAVYDFIVVGAGSAGCVVANRLTEDENINVLLIEAGGDPPVESLLPGALSFLPHSSYDWMYQSENDGYIAQEHLNKTIYLIRGKMLGGSSSNNLMVHIRGQPHDFEEWAKAAEDDTWSYENVLPYFIKSEKLDDDEIKKSHFAKYHGFDGYLGVTKQVLDQNLVYMKGFEELGHKLTPDLNADDTLGYTQIMYTRADGIRQSTARAYLTPIKDRPNLHVRKNTLVTKIIFDENKNAIGVEALTENNKYVTFKARKEVILSAGAFNTPQLLMLSGVGPKEHLESIGIEVHVDTPVGQNLQDHASIAIAIKTKKAHPPKLPHLPTKQNFDMFMGMVTINESQNYPDYETISLVAPHASIEPTFVMILCSFIITLNDEICQKYFDASLDGDVMYTYLSCLHPESRGEVLLQSTDPKDPPRIRMGYFSKDIDLERAAMFVEDYMNILDTATFKELEAEHVRPDLPKCDSFPYGSREYWRCFVLALTVSEWHFSGTCAMGSVVDSHLRLNGVHKLRVIDASVIPYINGANINAATIMIGEKGSDFIKKTHGLCEPNIKEQKTKKPSLLGLLSTVAKETKSAVTSVLSLSPLQLNFTKIASKMYTDQILPLLQINND